MNSFGRFFSLSAAAPLFVAPLFVTLLFVAPLTVSAQSNEKDFEKLMDAYLKSDKGPENIASAIQTHFQKKQQDGAKNELETAFKNPVKVDIGNSPTLGPKDAKVTIVEFSDFQCPFCTRGKQTMDEVMKMYPKDVKLVFKNLPLPMHPEAVPSAKAALAANKQGKFWEFHDALFANQAKLNEAFYLEQAKTLGLDVEKFKVDMASEEIAKQVKDDAELGNKLGINGTPGFFVNGVPVKGAYPVPHFKMIIDRVLAGGADAGKAAAAANGAAPAAAAKS